MPAAINKFNVISIQLQNLDTSDRELLVDALLGGEGAYEEMNDRLAEYAVANADPTYSQEIINVFELLKQNIAKLPALSL